MSGGSAAEISSGAPDRPSSLPKAEALSQECQNLDTVLARKLDSKDATVLANTAFQNSMADTLSGKPEYGLGMLALAAMLDPKQYRGTYDRSVMLYNQKNKAQPGEPGKQFVCEKQDLQDAAKRLQLEIKSRE